MNLLRSIQRLWATHVVGSLNWIDANGQLPPGRVSAHTRCTVVFFVGSLVLIAMSYGVLSQKHQRGIADVLIGFISDLDGDWGAAVRPYRELIRMIAWSLGSFTMYFVLPALVIRTVFGHRLRDYGLTWRGVRGHLWVYGLLFLPVAALVFVVAGNPDFRAKYPFYKNPTGLWDIIVWECFYALQFFSLEFFFRGFMLHGVKDKLGRYAIYVMLMPYAMIHFSKPFYETSGAIIAGTVLGILSLRSGSIFGGFLIHVGVALCMDIAALSLR